MARFWISNSIGPVQFFCFFFVVSDFIKHKRRNKATASTRKKDKALRIVSLYFKSFSGRIKIEDQCTWMLKRTDWSNWAIPPQERCLLFQDWIHFKILSLNWVQSSLLSLVDIKGTPTYLSGRAPTGIGKKAQIAPVKFWNFKNSWNRFGYGFEILFKLNHLKRTEPIALVAQTKPSNQLPIVYL